MPLDISLKKFTYIQIITSKSIERMYSPSPIIGYMHVIIESMTADEASQPIHAHISIGELSKVDSGARPSGSAFNETFLLEIPKDPSRLAIICN